MLISGTFTRTQFTEMISSVRRLLDQIEKHREKDLRDMGQESLTTGLEKLEIDEKPLQKQSLSNPTNKDVFDFLSSLDGGQSFVQTKDNPLSGVFFQSNTQQPATQSLGGISSS